MSWNPWSSVSEGHAGPGTSVTAVPIAGGRFALFLANPNGGVFTASGNSQVGWGRWSSVAEGHAGPGTSVTAVPIAGGRFALFLANPNGGVFTASGNSQVGWGQWSSVAEGHAGPGTSVTAVPIGGERFALFLANPNGGVFTASGNSQVGWGRWSSVAEGHAGPGTSVTAVPIAGGRFALFLANPDGGVFTASGNSQVGWGRWSSVAEGHAGPGTSVTAVPIAGSRFALFLANPNGGVFTASGNSQVGWGRWSSVAEGHAGPGTSVTAVPIAGGRFALFLANPNGGVFTASGNSQVGWGRWSSVAEGHAGPGTSVTAVPIGGERFALFLANPKGGVFTTSGDAARPADVANPADVAKREILQIEYQNPKFDRTDDWAKAIAGGTYPLHADFEWTQVLAPEEEYDQFGLVGAVGWMINPHHSSADVPFSHPFRDASTGTIFDWEFLLALDHDNANPNMDYAFLLAAGNHDDTKHVDETRQLGIPVPENGLLGVEIDGALVPQEFKDSAKTGNRVAVFGRWIVDTGHEVGGHATFKSEIHPPLLLASANVQKQVNGSLVTRVLFTSRPFLVGQRFTVEKDKIYDDRAEDDGPLFKHLIKELGKVASFIPESKLLEAHPKIKSHPFLGAHLLHIKVRPPALTGLPIITASKRLAVSFQFTVRTGCAVQVSSSSTDTVDVFISLSHGGYIPPPLPHRNAKRYSRQELDALSPGVGNKILAAEAGTLFAGALGGPANALKVAAILSRGIETDEYDPLPQIDINDAQHAVTDAFANAVPPGAGIVHDDAQRFPIFGWLEAKWVDSAVLHP